MSGLPDVTFYGASGHSQAIALQVGFASARPQRCSVVAFVDDVKGGQGMVLEGRPVVSWEEWLRCYVRLPCLVPMGRGDLRRAMVARVLEAGGRSARLYDGPGLALHGVSVGEGAIVCAPGYIGPNTAIGAHAQIMPMHSIGHDVAIAPYATVAPGAVVSGHVAIGEAAFIGAGAVIVPGRAGAPLTIGAGALVAAGAVVMKPVAAGARVFGNPARTIREIRARGRGRG